MFRTRLAAPGTGGMRHFSRCNNSVMQIASQILLPSSGTHSATNVVLNFLKQSGSWSERWFANKNPRGQLGSTSWSRERQSLALRHSTATKHMPETLTNWRTCHLVFFPSGATEGALWNPCLLPTASACRGAQGWRLQHLLLLLPSPDSNLTKICHYWAFPKPQIHSVHADFSSEEQKGR